MPWTIRCTLLALACLLSAWLPATKAAQAQSSAPTFSGSVQINYLALPSADEATRASTLDAATVELSLKVDVDISENVSAEVKVCVACHGLEVGSGYIEMIASERLQVRAGRFVPAFGDFPSRHDPANHLTSDKPLPYDMGRMVHLREWNLGILPAPWVDTGIEMTGAFRSDRSAFEYALYAVSGPKGANEDIDFDFVESRTPSRYYTDNNSRPTLGARISGSKDIGEESTVWLGASAMAGHYSDDAKLKFAIGGLDLVYWSPQLVLRAEYLLRRTDIFIGDSPETRFKFGPDASGRFDDFVTKDGFYLETEAPVGSVRLLARWDGLRRLGNVLANSELGKRSSVYRYTLGVSRNFAPRLVGKLSGEFYSYSDFGKELALNAALVAWF